MMPFNEEELIAYHLQELSPLRARAVRRALESDPELAAESEAIAETLRAFSSHEPVPQIDEAELAKYSAIACRAVTCTPQLQLALGFCRRCRVRGDRCSSPGAVSVALCCVAGFDGRRPCADDTVIHRSCALRGSPHGDLRIARSPGSPAALQRASRTIDHGSGGRDRRRSCDGCASGFSRTRFDRG